jgi:DNA-binding CsgD family transcriptional regulator
MRQAEKTSAALDACYEAVFAQAAWPEALDQLAASMNAVGCSFHAKDAGPERLKFPASPHYRDFLGAFYAEGWWKDDHRGRRAWPLAAVGRRVFIEHDIASDKDRRKMPVYHELYARYDVPWWGAAPFQVDGKIWAMPFLRSASQGPFLPAEKPILAGLGPHLARIVTLARHIAEVSAQSVLRSVQELRIPALLCDHDGRVLDLNRAAERCLGRGLGIRHGILMADDAASEADLISLVRTVSAAPSPAETPDTASVLVRRQGAPPLVVEAVPAAGVIADAFGYYGALLFIRDLQFGRTVPEKRMRAIFGLTEAEAKLAVLVGSGLTLRESAGRLRITEGTARVTLKIVFAKIGISRQAELVRLAERLGRRTCV